MMFRTAFVTPFLLVTALGCAMVAEARSGVTIGQAVHGMESGRFELGGLAYGVGDSDIGSSLETTGPPRVFETLDGPIEVDVERQRMQTKLGGAARDSVAPPSTGMATRIRVLDEAP